MKLKKYLLLILVVSITSCTKWLDVKPSDTVSEDQMFEVSEGYRIALHGIYKMTSSSALYGKELSWGLLSACSGDYIFSYSAIGYYHPYSVIASDYNYKDADAINTIDPIWKTAYQCIVNINNLIGNIKKEEDPKFEMGKLEKDLIHGEALAMRAMLHFDILRLYAPAPVKDDNKAYMPYYNQDGLSTGTSHTTVKEVLKNVVADLKQAQGLVAQYDTMDYSRQCMLSSTMRFESIYQNDIEDKDPFFAFRGYRMSYPAVTAILARVYNYMGEHELAYTEAQKVINMKFEGVSNLFTFTSNNEVETDKKTTLDLIFTLQDPKLYEHYLPHTIISGAENVGFFALSKDYSSLFDDKADYRQTKLMKLGEMNYYISLKNIKPKASDAKINAIADMLPVIRLSEMYYIAAEYFASKNQYVEATNALDAVRMGRNCTSGRLSITNRESFDKELIKEARREFFSEGQTYYYYKKLGIPVNSSMRDEHFIFIKPLDEDVQI